MALYFCRMAPQKNAAEIEDTPLAFRTPLNCSCFKSGKFTVLLKSGISMNPTDTAGGIQTGGKTKTRSCFMACSHHPNWLVFSYDSLVVRIRHPHSLHHLNQLMVDFGGLGPGVLDSWDSLMKGIVLLLRVNARIWNHQTNPNHQIYHWLIGIQSQKNKVFRIRPASKHYSTNMCCPSWNNNFLRPGNRGRQNLWRNLGAWKCMFL